MPRTTISNDNRVSSSTERYPKITLGKNERGRLYLFEQPWEEWSHRIEAPKIVNGEQLFIKTTDRNNNEIMKPDMLWLSSPICLGDIGILHDRGIDPDNCIACRESKLSGDIRGPEVRYAMNVLRYGLRPGGWELSAPPSMSVIAWTFPGSRYDKILELQNITGQPAVSSPGAPAMYDVLIGPCEDAGYQKYNITHAPEVAWQRLGGAKEYIAQLLPNRATDAQLRELCGSERNLSQIQADITQAKLLFTQARNAGQQPQGPDVFGTAFGGQDMQAQVGDLMASASQFSQAPGQAVAFPTAPPAQPQAAPAPAADPFASMVPAAALAQPAPQAAPAPPVASFPATPAADLTGHPGGLAEFAPPAQQAAPAFPTMTAPTPQPQAVPGATAPASAVPASVLGTPAVTPASTAQPGDMSLQALMDELG